jgi:hypothetical protein
MLTSNNHHLASMSVVKAMLSFARKNMGCHLRNVLMIVS